jgi:hypothetical protein
VNEFSACFATTSAAAAAGIVADKTTSAPVDTTFKLMAEGLILATTAKSNLIESSLDDVYSLNVPAMMSCTVAASIDVA